MVDSAGFLTTANGHTVLARGGGPIAVPGGLDLSVADDSSILATDPSLPEAPPTVVGNLLLRDSEGARLVRRVDGLYEVTWAHAGRRVTSSRTHATFCSSRCNRRFFNQRG